VVLFHTLHHPTGGIYAGSKLKLHQPPDQLYIHTNGEPYFAHAAA
jgi:hypothetical protein